jgi:hypothetical protein
VPPCAAVDSHTYSYLPRTVESTILPVFLFFNLPVNRHGLFNLWKVKNVMFFRAIFVPVFYFRIAVRGVVVFLEVLTIPPICPVGWV